MLAPLTNPVWPPDMEPGLPPTSHPAFGQISRLLALGLPVLMTPVVPVNLESSALFWPALPSVTQDGWVAIPGET